MVAPVLNILSTENELFRTYLFYCSVLILKMAIMGPLTGIQRFKHMSFANPEDAAVLRVKPRTDENVERVRRANQNDVESIPIFFVASFIYILTNPPVAFATLLFRVFTAARIIHTIVYAVVVIPQPSRMLAYGVGLITTVYMAFQGILYFML